MFEGDCLYALNTNKNIFTIKHTLLSNKRTTQLNEYTYTNYDIFKQRSIIATCQLAKHQLTWLNSWETLNIFKASSVDLLKEIAQFVEKRVAS